MAFVIAELAAGVFPGDWTVCEGGSKGKRSGKSWRPRWRILHNRHMIQELSEKGANPMENSYIFIRFLVVLMMISALASCASTPQKESTGEYFDDSVIKSKIKDKLAKDDFLKSFQIRVDSRKGVVQLSGFVDSQNLIDKAGEVAQGIEGVKSVKNDLIVK
jgi:hyperosmotically inducible protein